MAINEYTHAIIGAVIGVGINIIVIPVVCFFMRRRNSKKQKEQKEQKEVFIGDKLKLKLLTINADQSFPQDTETRAIKEALGGENAKNFKGVAVIAMQEIDMSPTHIFCFDFLFRYCKTRQNKVMTQWVNFFRGVFFTDKYSVDAKNNAHFLLVGAFAMILINKTGKELTDLHFEKWRYGKGKFLGNKSAVGAFFKVGEKNVGILGAHLDARADETRNEKRKKRVEMLMNSSVQIDGPSNKVKDIECLVFMGDLNFRVPVQNSEQNSIVPSKWSVEDFENKDQLRQYIKKENCPLKGFKEFFELDEEFDGNILPSYKYYTRKQEGNLNDSQKKVFVEDKKNRQHYLNIQIKNKKKLCCKKKQVQNLPSLTDRILYNFSGVELKEHKLLLEVKYSDHKPVFEEVSIDFQANTSKSEFSTILDGTMLI